MSLYIGLMLFAQLLASVSQLLLKKSADKEYGSFLRSYLNLLVIGGYGLLVVSMFLSIVCYGGMPYMYVVIIEPVSYVMVMLLARLFFQEKLTARKLLGMTLILGGILVFYLL
ncbi:MAG: multidrug ABC transporter [Butyrivibrio sp.]|nr:multidrug ABC transporter [Butyrivibrio sp.]